MDMKSAVVLLSGGQDSTTCLAWALENFEAVHAVSFYYGQRHRREINAACDIAAEAGVAHHHVLDLSRLFDQVAKSALLERGTDIGAQSHHDPGLPASFVPYRNVYFITTAAAYAYQHGIGNLVAGICQTDYSGYPDCRNEFAKAINTALTLASAQPLEIHTPLMWMTKAETVEMIHDMGCESLLRWSHTCYEGAVPPCLQCPACVLRAKGFTEAGVPDPLLVRMIEEGKLPSTANSMTGEE